MRRTVFDPVQRKLESNTNTRIKKLLAVLTLAGERIETSTRTGFPDWLIFAPKSGRCLMLESKSVGLKPNYQKGQLATLQWYARYGVWAKVAIMHEGTLYFMPPKERYTQEDCTEENRAEKVLAAWILIDTTPKQE